MAHGKFKVAAGLTTLWIEVLIAGVVSLRSKRIRESDDVAWVVIILVMTFFLMFPYLWVSDSLGWGIPVNLWRDMVAGETILVSAVEEKRTAHHIHSGESDESGWFGSDVEHYHSWIFVSGREWSSTDQNVYNLLQKGDMVEVAYWPTTKRIIYIKPVP